MDLGQSSQSKMRARVSKTPAALEAYDAFESQVESALIIWPKLSADRAAGFIMSAWTAQAVRAGHFKIARDDLNWIVGAGQRCRRELKGAEKVWVRDLAAHLLRTASRP